MIQLDRLVGTPYVQAAAVFGAAIAHKASLKAHLIAMNSLPYLVCPYLIKLGYNKLSQGGCSNIYQGACYFAAGVMGIIGTIGLNIRTINELAGRGPILSLI